MRLQIQIETSPPDLLAKLQRAPETATGVLDEMVEELARDITFRAKNYAPYTTGALRRSIAPHRVVPAEWEVIAVGSERRPYAAYMEFGTKPHWPPVEAIRDWVRIKLRIADADEIKRVAFLVSRAIARRGTAARNYMKRAVEETSQEAQSIASRYLSKLIWAIAEK